jgi:hypothetical protein
LADFAFSVQFLTNRVSHVDVLKKASEYGIQQNEYFVAFSNATNTCDVTKIRFNIYVWGGEIYVLARPFFPFRFPNFSASREWPSYSSTTS